MNNRACQHRKVRMSFLPSNVQFKVNRPAKTWKGCDVRFYCLVRKNRLYDGLLSVRNLNFRALRACYGYQSQSIYLAHTRISCYAVLWFSFHCCLLYQDGYLCQNIRIPRFRLQSHHSLKIYQTNHTTSSKFNYYSVIDFYVLFDNISVCVII